MIGALAYIALISIKNRVLMAVRKLRNARYLISALFGLGYFAMVFGRNIGRNSKRFSLALGFDSMGMDIAAGIMFLILLVVWAWPIDDAGVELSESEMQLLFSAPVSRGGILFYKFMRAQLPILISAVMTTVMMGQWRNAIGMWFVFATMSLYMTMVQQMRARLRRMRIGFLIRLAVVISIIAGVSWVTVHAGTFKTPLLAALTFIPRFFAMAALPNVPLLWRLLSFVVVSVLGALCFLVSASVDVDFEEGSMAISRRKANTVTRQRSQQSGQWMAFKRLPPPFRLADTGAPEIAIIWKNLIASLRIGMMPIVFLFAALAFPVGFSFFVPAPAVNALGGGILFMCAVIPLLGANLFSQDLRLDITRIEYLKTFPISGERLVAAEMAAPMIVMSLVELIFLGVTALYLNFRMSGGVARFATPQNILCVFIFAIPICAILTVMRNAAVLLFPAWTIRSKEEPRGLVVTGQRLVVALGNLVVLAVALIPAAIVFVPAILIANRFFSGSPGFLAMASLPPLALIAGEVWLGVRLLGKYFDTFDASNELDRILT
jgi:ABC-2 type transport system permease protein